MRIWRYAVNHDIQIYSACGRRLVANRKHMKKYVPSASFRFTMLLFTALVIKLNSTWFVFPLMNQCKVSYSDNWSKHTVFHQIPVSIIECAWKEEIHIPPGPTSGHAVWLAFWKNNSHPAVQLINCCVGKSAMSGWILADFGWHRLE